MPQSLTVTPAAIVRRHFTKSCNIFIGYATITDGISLSVYFQQDCFFGAQFPSVKPSVIYFFLPTDLLTECSITNKWYAEGLFPSAI
jgi:hypothetical protein